MYEQQNKYKRITYKMMTLRRLFGLLRTIRYSHSKSIHYLPVTEKKRIIIRIGNSPIHRYTIFIIQREIQKKVNDCQRENVKIWPTIQNQLHLQNHIIITIY